MGANVFMWGPVTFQMVVVVLWQFVLQRLVMFSAFVDKDTPEMVSALLVVFLVQVQEEDLLFLTTVDPVAALLPYHHVRQCHACMEGVYLTYNRTLNKMQILKRITVSKTSSVQFFLVSSVLFVISGHAFLWPHPLYAIVFRDIQDLPAKLR